MVDFNHSSLSPFHPQKIKGRFTGDPKLAGPLLGGQPFKGRDGLVRSALVKTSQGVVRRTVTVLHMLEAVVLDTLKVEKH